MSLLLKTLERFPGNQYEPRHVRAIYFDDDKKSYVAQATIGDCIIAEVESATDYDAYLTLSTRLVKVFRAMKAAA